MSVPQGRARRTVDPNRDHLCHFANRAMSDELVSPCMGPFLSRGARLGSFHFSSLSFFARHWRGLFLGSLVARSCECKPNFSSSTAPQAFPRPDRQVLTPARAEAVKDGAKRHPARGLSLNGFEHDGTLGRVGDDEVRGELRVGARSIVPHPCMRRARDPDHDAGIRIGSKLRGGGPIL